MWERGDTCVNITDLDRVRREGERERGCWRRCASWFWPSRAGKMGSRWFRSPQGMRCSTTRIMKKRDGWVGLDEEVGPRDQKELERYGWDNEWHRHRSESMKRLSKSLSSRRPHEAGGTPRGYRDRPRSKWMKTGRGSSMIDNRAGRWRAESRSSSSVVVLVWW